MANLPPFFPRYPFDKIILLSSIKKRLANYDRSSIDPQHSSFLIYLIVKYCTNFISNGLIGIDGVSSVETKYHLAILIHYCLFLKRKLDKYISIILFNIINGSYLLILSSSWKEGISCPNTYKSFKKVFLEALSNSDMMRR